jgi:hypothetical protein
VRCTLYFRDGSTAADQRCPRNVGLASDSGRIVAMRRTYAQGHEPTSRHAKACTVYFLAVDVVRAVPQSKIRTCLDAIRAPPATQLDDQTNGAAAVSGLIVADALSAGDGGGSPELNAAMVPDLVHESPQSPNFRKNVIGGGDG